MPAARAGTALPQCPQFGPGRPSRNVHGSGGDGTPTMKDCGSGVSPRRFRRHCTLRPLTSSYSCSQPLSSDAVYLSPIQHSGMAFNRSCSRNLRIGRYSQPGQYYFLTTSVHGRRWIFSSEERAQIILDAIRWLSDSGRFATDAAVVMPDHLHLVGQLGSSSLEQVMHTLKSYTAHRLAESGVEAPIWQDGYHDHGLRNEEDYRSMVTYVLQNPVRAGLARRVDDYPFTLLPCWWKQPACG